MIVAAYSKFANLPRARWTRFRPGFMNANRRLSFSFLENRSNVPRIACSSTMVASPEVVCTAAVDRQIPPQPRQSIGDVAAASVYALEHLHGNWMACSQPKVSDLLEILHITTRRCRHTAVVPKEGQMRVAG
jgi:hypothetical protein